MVERSDSQRLQHPEGDHLRSVADDVSSIGSMSCSPTNCSTIWPSTLFSVAIRVGSSCGSAPTTPASCWSAARRRRRRPALTTLRRKRAARHRPATDWVRERRRRFPEALVVVLDYAAATSALLEREGEWLRAYRSHDRVVDWLADPGRCDITIDLPTEQLAAIGSPIIETQAAFLRRHGIDALVEEGRRAWEASAHVGDLAALRARSRSPKRVPCSILPGWVVSRRQLAEPGAAARRRNPCPPYTLGMTVTERAPLNRALIAETALSLIDERGLDQLSMRKLGASSGLRRCRSTTMSTTRTTCSMRSPTACTSTSSMPTPNLMGPGGFGPPRWLSAMSRSRSAPQCVPAAGRSSARLSR